MSTNRFEQTTTSGAFRRTSWRSARWASIAATVLAAIAAPADEAHAQSAGTGFEVRPFVGAYIPTGDQRDVLKDAVLAGAQASWRVLPSLAVTGTFGWAPSKDRITPGDQTLDIYQYDVGAELRADSWYYGGSWDFSPFVGLGAGGRTYNYRDLDQDATTNFAGFGAIGGDIGFGSVALRIEARDYLSRFKPLTGSGETTTRNDVGLAAGVSSRF